MHSSDLDWNTSYQNDRDYTWLSTSRLSHILHECQTPARASVLDIGCGTGQLCRDLAHRGYQVLGVDISSEAIKLAKASTTLPSQVIHFSVADVEKREVKQAGFDLIFCKYVLAFIRDKAQFAQYVSSLLSERGSLVLISPDPASLAATKQHIAMNHEEVMQILQPHFHAVRSEKIANDYYYFATK